MGFDDVYLEHRCCPVCYEDRTNSEVFVPKNFDDSILTKFSFASRKLPEFMTWGYVKCANCDVVYCPETPKSSVISSFYKDSDFDSDIEAKAAAKTYGKLLKKGLKSKIANKGIAVDIGCGPAPLFPHLRDLGFTEVLGIEPSEAAIQKAPIGDRKNIHHGIFEKAAYSKNTIGLFCLFQTIEHVAEPRELFENVYDMLEPGGVFAIVCHNRDGVVNRILGKKSPIIDIEHLQLFNKKSLYQLCDFVGFENVEIKSFWNYYSFKYLVRLLPINKDLKMKALNFLLKLRLSSISFPVPFGNVFIVGRKPFLRKD